MDETEVRCAHCERRHPDRRPPLLATLHGGQILEPVRLSSAKAKELGIPRGGLFWHKAIINPCGEAVLRCRRCGQVRLYALPEQEFASRSSGGADR